MGSLWGASKGGEQTEHDDAPTHSGEASHDRHAAAQIDQDVDERSHLLPPPGHAGYLDPDDPAVRGNPLPLYARSLYG